MTSHGSPLTPQTPPGGSRNVFIGKKAAWRVGDQHVCPLTTGTVPHKGGAVVKGSTTVFINKRPAARAGDAIVEAGPPNPIAAGCPTVRIGG